MTALPSLPAGVQVFERGWLSSNNTLLIGNDSVALVDSGYCTHADQTLELVNNVLGTRALNVLANTHLHSDHCGGNALLQTRYPDLLTLIPPGHAAEVEVWDTVALTYAPTGQQCPRFRFGGTLKPDTSLQLGAQVWDIHAAKGHDPHSVILFEPRTRTLISADALWESGFGVVFPELEGVNAFDEVGATLDLIEELAPATVIPGHGRAFIFNPEILGIARRRLDGLASSPAKHARHAAKVLLKFKLLEVQQLPQTDLLVWAKQTAYFNLIFQRFFPLMDLDSWLTDLCNDLVRSGAALRHGNLLLNG